MTKTLTPTQAKTYYDNFGSKQDSQGFYENKPVTIAIKKANFNKATNIIEFGCGTGKRASELFKEVLTQTCTYTGQDISETMISLAQKNLEKWSERAILRLSDGSTKLQDKDNTYDRFFSSYVLDLLPDEKIVEVLKEAKRVLTAEGKLCLVGITTGKNIVTKVVSGGWMAIFKLRPKTVGGCRPLKLLKYVSEDEWEIEYHQKVSATLVTSEILVARPKK